MNTERRILFIVGTHGKEQAPLRLFYEIPYGKVTNTEWEVIVANPEACMLNTRYIDHDLNRIDDSQDMPEIHEWHMRNRIAKRILEGNYNVVYDVHTTSKIGKGPDSVFINTFDEENRKAASYAATEHVIWDKADNDMYITSLHPVGVTLEYQKTHSIEDDYYRIRKDVNRIIYQGHQREQVYYEGVRPVTQEEFEATGVRLVAFQRLIDEEKKALRLPEGEYMPMFVDPTCPDGSYCYINRILHVDRRSI